MNEPIDYRLSDRMSTVDPSPFVAIMRAAKAVEAAGKKVIFLSVGEPDFPTHDRIKAAGIRAIKNGETRYTAADGTPEVKHAILQKLARDNALHYTPDQITVTLGGTQGIFNTMFATVGPGDEVILPAPYFQPYISAIRLAGATPVVLKTREEDAFVPRATDIAAAITPRTRWLVLNSPSNPAGAVIEEADLSAIAEVIRANRRLLVFSDDIYEATLFGDAPFRNIVNVAPDMADRTVILNGVSKAYSMTGWRLGYLAGPKEIIAGVSQVSANSTFTPSSIAQAAAVEALAGPQDQLVDQRKAFEHRRDLVLRRLNSIPGLRCATPKGAFFAFTNCQRLIGRRTPDGSLIESDLDVVLYVLNSTGLATVQGSAFGMPGYFRVSYAASEDILAEAMNRLAGACAALQ